MPYGPFHSSRFDVWAWGCNQMLLWHKFFYKDLFHKNHKGQKLLKITFLLRIILAHPSPFQSFWKKWIFLKIFLKLLISYCLSKITFALSVNDYLAKLGWDQFQETFTILIRFCTYIRNSLGINVLKSNYLQIGWHLLRISLIETQGVGQRIAGENRWEMCCSFWVIPFPMLWISQKTEHLLMSAMEALIKLKLQH